MGRPKLETTPRRESVLAFVRAYASIHGVSPSLQVIASGLGLKSRANIHRIVARLQADGLVTKTPRKYRSLKVVASSGVEAL